MRVYENFPSHAKNRSSRFEQNGTATLTGQNREVTLPHPRSEDLFDTFTNQGKTVLPPFEEDSKLHNLISMCPTDTVEVNAFSLM